MVPYTHSWLLFCTLTCSQASGHDFLPLMSLSLQALLNSWYILSIRVPFMWLGFILLIFNSTSNAHLFQLLISLFFLKNVFGMHINRFRETCPYRCAVCAFHQPHIFKTLSCWYPIRYQTRPGLAEWFTPQCEFAASCFSIGLLTVIYLLWGFWFFFFLYFKHVKMFF